MQPPPLDPSRGPIALVAPRYPPALGGVESHVGHLAAGLRDYGLGVEVMTCDPTGRLPARSIQDGVLVHRFRTLGDDDVYYLSPGLGRWLLAEAGRFSLIHAHGYHTPAALEALVAARRAGRPFVLTPHYHGTGHSPIRRLLHRPYRILGRELVRASRPLICVSHAERSLLQRHFGQHLPAVVVPNGVEVEEIRAAQPFQREGSGRLIVSAGRLEPYKHVEQVVAAVSHLPTDDRLVVIGAGPARTTVEACITNLGLAGRVRVLGVVSTPDLRRWLRSADVVVGLSSHEAFGIGLLEAASAGAGVVASDIPAHREVASYLPTGRVAFVPWGASPHVIAAAITGMHRSAVDDAGVDRVPRWRDTVAGTLRAYALALEGRRNRRSHPPGAVRASD